MSTTNKRRLADAQRLLKQLRKSTEHSKEFAEIYQSRAEQYWENWGRGVREIAFWEKEIEQMEKIEAAE